MKLWPILIFVISFGTTFGQFAPPQIIPPSMRNVQFQDINSDGHPDLIGISHEFHYHDKRKLAWIANENGEGEFQDQKIILDLPSLERFFVRDLDGDTDLDVLIATGDNIYYLLNTDGLGNFQAPILLNQGAPDLCLNGFNIADINGDGLNDVVMRESCPSRLGWYKNLGGTFDTFEVIYNESFIGSSGNDIYAFDGDNDGDIDLYELGLTSHFFMENLGGDGNFAEEVGLVISDIAIKAIRDMNGDGFLDFVAKDNHDIVWFENAGDGTFLESNNLAYSLGYEGMAVGDLDVDGDTDILLSEVGVGAGLSWLENVNGQGTFTQRQEIFNSSIVASTFLDYINGPSIIDLNDDGDMDLFVFFGNVGYGWYENTGAIDSFTNFSLVGSLGLEGRISSGDLDSVPGNDIILTNDFGIVIHKNLDGGHKFSASNILEKNGKFNALVDLNGDGLEDIIVDGKIPGTITNSLDMVGWMENLGQGEFSGIELFSEEEFHFVSASDLDNDNDIDIIVKQHFLPPDFYVFENLDNAGTFSNAKALVEDKDPNSQFLDLNGDNLPDFIFKNSNPYELLFYANMGNNEFDLNPILIAPNVFYHDLVRFFDFDDDGDIDVIYLDDEYLMICLNDGLGNFSDAEFIVELDGTSTVTDIKFFDVDLDNSLDIVVKYHNTITTYSKNYLGDFYLLNSIHDAASPDIDLTVFDVDGDGDQDILTKHWSHPVFIENYSNDPVLKGNVFWDENENGIRDSLEIGLYRQTVSIEPNAFDSFTSPEGYFSFSTGGGVVELSCVSTEGWAFTTDSIISFDLPDSNDTIYHDFGLKLIDSTTQLSIDLTSSPTRCGFEVPFWLSYENTGATYMDGHVHLVFDSLFSDSLSVVDSLIINDSMIVFESVSPTPDSIDGFNVYWNFEDLAPTEFRQIDFSIRLPGPEFLGDTLFVDGGIVALNEEMDTLFASSIDYESEINCAYDPNDKLVEPSYDDFENYTLIGDTLVYTIRFQNTGTDTAFYVRIEDVLSPDLDLSTLRVISSSHPQQTIIDGVGQLSFHFYDILLPPEIQNESASNGFVKFSIVPRADIETGTGIDNTAGIFFDFNPPIITNTVSSLMVDEFPVYYEAQDPPCHGGNQGEISILFPPADFNFLWPDNSTDIFIDRLVEGEYFLQVYDDENTLIADTLILITAPDELGNDGISTSPATMGLNNGSASTQAIGGTPPYTYTWSTDPVQTGESIEGLAPGEYELSITDANSCVYVESFTISGVNSVSDLPENWIFTISPNPNGGQCLLSLELPSQVEWSLSITNLLGQEIKQIPSTDFISGRADLNLDLKDSGLYMVRLNVMGTSYVEKIIVLAD